MFEILKNFLNNKRGIAGQHIAGASYDFVLLDPKHVSNQFNIKELAIQNGQNELPKSGNSSRDPIEDEISSHFNALEIDQGNNMSSRIDSYQRSLKSLSADLDLVSLEAERVMILNEAKAAVETSSNDLYGLDRNFKAADSELKDFVKNNKLERKAPQNQSNSVLKVGILFVMFLIESIINTTFFAGASDSGILGGFSYAVLISSLNLVLPFFVAWRVIPYKNSIHLNEKYIGWFGVFSLVAILIIINLAGGHIREVMQNPSISGNFEVIALQNFKDNPFLFGSIFTYYFSVLGLIFAAFAFFDGYKFDDPYPNFGMFWRAADKITARMQRHYARSVSDTNYLFNEFNNELQKKLKSIDSRKQLFSSNQNNITSLKTKFDSFQKQLTSVYKAVISEYRMLNIKNRKTLPPAYFKQPVKYQITYYLENMPDTKFYNEIDSILKEAHRDIPKMISKMEAEHQKLIKKIPKLVDLAEIQ